MSYETEVLATALSRVLDQRHGKFYGRVGYLLLVLIDVPEYLASDLTTNRVAFIKMIYSRAGDLGKRGFAMTFSEFETGPCVLIERKNSHA